MRELLNQQLGITSDQAQELYQNGADIHALRASGRHVPIDGMPEGAVLSENNQWLVRETFVAYEAYGDPNEECLNAKTEFARFIRKGIPVISFGMTPSPDYQHIYTVTPWIPTIQLCPPSLFTSQIKPRVTSYFQDKKCELGTTGITPLYLLDQTGRDQYSVKFPGSQIAFAHDISPGATSGRAELLTVLGDLGLI